MIKIHVRAIVPTENAYVLMGDRDKNDQETWDLPGGELKAGIDVKEHLRQLVLENTGYSIVNLNFFEVTCKIKPRTRGQDPVTIIDFIFSSKPEATELKPAAKETQLLPFAKFEWLESAGRFQQNKVMNLLTRYHRLYVAVEDSSPASSL